MALFAGLGVSIPSAGGAAATGGMYVPLTPSRILDSRNGTGGYSTPWGAGVSRSVTVEGVGGVPSSDVVAVDLNVTTTNSTANSFLAIYPEGGSRPTSTAINPVDGVTVSNNVVAVPGSDAKVAVYNNAGSTDVIFDVEGYYTSSTTGSSATYVPLQETRVMDTRTGLGGDSSPVGETAVNLSLAGLDGVPSSGVAAVVLGLGAANETKNSYLTLWPSGTSEPAVSTLNYSEGVSVENTETVALGVNGEVSIAAAAGSTDVFVDLYGYYLPGTGSGASFIPVNQTRLLDTRTGSKIQANSTISLQVDGATTGVPTTGVTAEVLNFTSLNSSAAGYVVAYADGTSQPSPGSTLDTIADETADNEAIVPVGPDGVIKIFSSVTTDLLVDLQGYFQASYGADHFVAYVADGPSNAVTVVDPSAQAATGYVALPSGADPVAVATSPDGAYAYVADKGTNAVSVLKATDLDSSTDPDIANTTVGDEPDAVAVDPSGDDVLVANSGSGGVSVLDGNPSDATFSEVSYTVTLPGTSPDPVAVALSPDGSYAYVVDAHNKTVDVLQMNSAGLYEPDGTTGSFTGTPEAIAISPDDEEAYVTDSPSSGDGTLDSFSLASPGSFGTRSTYAVGDGPGALGLDPAGSVAYVSNTTGAEVSEVSLATGSVTSFSATSPSGLAVTPDGKVLLVADDASADSVALTGANGGALGSPLVLPSGSVPGGIAVSPAFVSSSGESLVGYEQDTNPAVAASSNVDDDSGVNTATGGYTFHNDDLSLPDIGISLDLSQGYDSAAAATDGPIGYGWSFSYGMTATETPAGDGGASCEVTISEGDGASAVFYPPGPNPATCPSSGYLAPSFEQATLSVVSDCYDGDSCWEMTVEAGTESSTPRQATSSSRRTATTTPSPSPTPPASCRPSPPRAGSAGSGSRGRATTSPRWRTRPGGPPPSVTRAGTSRA